MNLPRFERSRGVFGDGRSRSMKGYVHKHQLPHQNFVGGVGSYQKRGFNSYAEVVVNNVLGDEKKLGNLSSREEDKSRFYKVMVGKVSIPGSSYIMLVAFHSTGIFFIRVSALGPNLCILKELEEGAMKELLGDDVLRWKEWFSEVRRERG